MTHKTKRVCQFDHEFVLLKSLSNHVCHLHVFTEEGD